MWIAHMSFEEPYYVYKALMVPPREPPAYAWAAERIVAASQRLEQIFAITADIQARAVGKAVRVTATRGDDGDEHPQFTHPTISSQDERTRLGILGSEMINHVRTALDYFAYVDSWKAAGGEPEHRTAFPLCLSPEAWRDRNVRKKVAGMTRQGAEAVETAQPFRGVEWARRLSELSNLDKHRQAVVLSPTIEWKCPRNFSGLLDEELETRVTVSVLFDDGVSNRFQDEAKQMLTGAVELLNPFLVDDGDQPVMLAFNF